MQLRQKQPYADTTKDIKIISIVSYLLIILAGDMIGLPFICWLLFVSFDFGNLDQIFAILAVVGLIINFRTLNSIRTLKILLLDILCFLLLASPLARRIAVVPIEKFNYLAFIIPTTIFVSAYFLSLYFSVRQYQQTKKATFG